MIQTNRVTILVPDNSVYLDQGAFVELDLSDCGIPSEIRALDWKDGKGELHHHDTTLHHIAITELPDWAMKCISKWETQYTESLIDQTPITIIENEPNP